MLCPKKRCPDCGGTSVVKNGHYANGRQRLFCKICRHSFHSGIRAGTHNREKVWFDKWIIEGYSVRQICHQSGHSRDKLYRIIDHWLDRSPEPDTGSLERVSNVILDGTFLYKRVSIVTMMDARTNAVIDGEFDVRENSEHELIAFLSPLKERGLNPVSCTTDGNPQVIYMLRKLWPGIITQRCLVHIQRQGLSWCRISPKREDARKLRDLFRVVTYIRTKKERDAFLLRLSDWEQEYGHLIAKKPGKGRVFSDLKGARSMLVRALPNMFHYLDDPDIPPTTNALEGYFSRLKGHYQHHRGMSPEKRSKYFAWYFRLKPR